MNPKSKTEQAAEWLAEYLTHQPQFRAESAQVRRDAEQAGWPRRTIEQARVRAGVGFESGSLPGRPFVTWWVLPSEKTTGVVSADLSDALALVRAVSTGDVDGQRVVLANARPLQTTLAVAMLAGFLAEAHFGSLPAGLVALHEAVDGWVAEEAGQ